MQVSMQPVECRRARPGRPASEQRVRFLVEHDGFELSRPERKWLLQSCDLFCLGNERPAKQNGMATVSTISGAATVVRRRR